MGPSRVSGAGGPSQSSGASGIFFQGNGHGPAVVSSIPGNGQSGLGPSSGEINCGIPNSTTNSPGPSVGASSLVTDANSALSGVPRLQRSTSVNNDSYPRLPNSPMSFSSNNVSGASLMDGSSLVQLGLHQEQMQKQGASSATSQLTMAQEPRNSLHAQKTPKLDMRQHEDIMHLLQRQESFQLQGHQNPHLQAIIQQQRLSQRVQPQQLLSQMQRPQMHPQLRHNNLQHQTVQPALPMRHPSESGLCDRRLKQYMYHQRHRPPDNSVLYWRKFVVEYFAPRARKRWCLAMYGNADNNAGGVFPQATLDAWQCGVCGSRSGKGFEATFEVLPRLFQIEFDSGLIDELLFLDMPQEFRLASGMMLLEYAKAVQESVYEQRRVVRDGQLRIVFTPDLKILSWEFCARRHEEFFLRRLLGPQVNQLLQVAQKYQIAANDSGSAGASPQDLRVNCNMFVAAGRQLARSLELQSLNDFGFSKRYVRVLQISEVVNSMKDLIDFGQVHKIGPIDSLKNYPPAKRQGSKTLEVEQPMTTQGLANVQNTLDKIKALHPGLNGPANNNQTAANGCLNNTAQTAMELNNYEYLRRTSTNSNQNGLQPEMSRAFTGPNQSQIVPSRGLGPSTLASQSINNGSPGLQQHQPQTLQNSNPQSSQADQQLQQHVIQQLLQDMMNNGGACQQQQPITAPCVNRSMAAEEVLGSGISTGSLAGRMNAGLVRNGVEMANNMSIVSAISTGMISSSSSSSKSVANNNSNISANSFDSGPVAPQNICLPELDQDLLAPGLLNNGMFNGETGDMSFGWKV